MAKTYGFQIASQLASKHLIDADNVKGGFCVVATTSDRDKLPAAYGVTDGIITKGSLVYCQSSSELYVCTGVELVGSKPTATWTEFVSGGDVNPMVFMGTLGSSDATISVLPDTSSANKGNVYKVKTEGTYTYNTNKSVTVKVGDTLISNETEWVVIPSGDEPTYTDVSKQSAGLCPILPNESTTTKFLRQDGTWQVPNYPTSLPASDVSSWAKASTKPSYSWSEITGKPSTFTPSSHTHTTSIATSSATNQITLGFGSKYAITAGGTSYVFTMPSNPNTDSNVTQNKLSDPNSGNKYYLLLGRVNSTSTETASVNKCNYIYVEPTSEKLYTQGINAGIINASSVYATAIYQTSDDRLKNYKGDFHFDIKDLENIPLRYFEYKDDEKHTRHIGTSAQAIVGILPELVGEEEYMSVDYSKLSLVAIDCIKQLKSELEVLKEEVKRLSDGI